MTSIDITAVSKLKHAALYKAAKELGGQAALARHLGVQAGELGRWCNLNAVPNFEGWDTEKRAVIEKKLYDLTGLTLDEIFPSGLQAATEFLQANKTSEKTASLEIAALLDYAEHTRERLRLESPEDAAYSSSRKSAVANAMKSLSFREREVLKLRFEQGLTLEQAGEVFKASKERIRQIEAKAIWKLQQPSRAKELVGYAE